MALDRARTLAIPNKPPEIHQISRHRPCSEQPRTRWAQSETHRKLSAHAPSRAPLFRRSAQYPQDHPNLKHSIDPLFRNENRADHNPRVASFPAAESVPEMQRRQPDVSTRFISSRKRCRTIALRSPASRAPLDPLRNRRKRAAKTLSLRPAPARNPAAGFSTHSSAAKSRALDSPKLCPDA